MNEHITVHDWAPPWFHQPLRVIDNSGGRLALERRYSRLVGLPLVRLPRYPGSATSWQNHPYPKTPAFGPPKSSNIYTMRTDGTGLRQLTHATGGTINDGLDSWSPDGKKIAFVSNTSGTYEIYTMNADGTGVTQLTHGPAAHLAAWGTHP